MKKIVKLFILMCVCFIPVMVDAKANFELEAEMDNKLLLEIVDDKYIFFDANYDETEVGSIVIFDSKGKMIKETFLVSENDGPTPYLDKLMFLVYDAEGHLLIADDTYYSIMYGSEKISFDNNVTGETEEFSFSDNLELTKKILGKKYDAFLEVKAHNVTVDFIREYNGYFVVYYYDDNDDYVSIMDSNYNIIKTFEGYDAYDYTYYAYDNLIYVLKNNKNMAIYKADGTLYQTYRIENDKIGDEFACGGLYPVKVLIENNQMFILYLPRRCVGQQNTSYDAEDLVKEVESSPDFLTLVYDFNFEVEKTEPSNGDFTYTSKFDDEGREYVELKISPLKGYSVEDIIVTDINGKRIDVTNNKFYMPASDVRVEVKFGEYIPIPDTFSNISPIIIVISILLIGFGIGIMSFSLKSKKVN